MPTVRFVRFLPVIAVVAAVTGCLDRRFVVETNAPGAQVFVNGRPTGPSPADTGWEYPGRYEFRVVAPGYEPLTECRLVKARWYDYAPFDFLVGVLWPFHVEDIRRFRFDLTPAKQVSVAEVEARAAELRARANQLPQPSVPNDDRSAPGAGPGR